MSPFKKNNILTNSYNQIFQTVPIFKAPQKCLLAFVVLTESFFCLSHISINLPYALVFVIFCLFFYKAFYITGGNQIIEQTFKGPLQDQLRSALRYIQNNILTEKIVKHPDKAEADRFFNYPYAAIEEALSNAVYHKGYDEREPIEVRVEIGEFLKELHLTEGRNTGFKKILEALQKNGSPLPEFETDEGHSYFISRIFIHPDFIDEKISSEKDIKEVTTPKLPPNYPQKYSGKDLGDNCRKSEYYQG